MSSADAERDRDTAPGTSLLFDVFATNQAVARLLAAAMRDSPLTAHEYAVYSAIFELEAATPTVLAGRLGMPLTTLADQLRAMEARGHTARLPNPTDRRSYRVVLSAAGRDAHRAANAGFEAAHRAFTGALPQGEERPRLGLRDIRAAAERAVAERAATGSQPALPSRRRSPDRGG